MSGQIKNNIDTINTQEFPQVLEVWEASVRATHHFLTEQDIQFFKPLVQKGLLHMVELACMRDSKDNITGFIGVEKEKIEMLFIHPSWFGKRIGYQLAMHAINVLDAKYVDVNEQNEQAVGFYKHIGFTVIGRSETDSMSKPFPLLHMQFSGDKK
jgi:putative acetyltransferase